MQPRWADGQPRRVIITRALFPDNDYIEVYVERRAEAFALSDYADTAGWLFMQGLDDEEAHALLTRAAVADDRVTLVGGALWVRECPPSAILSGVRALARAMQRAARASRGEW